MSEFNNLQTFFRNKVKIILPFKLQQWGVKSTILLQQHIYVIFNICNIQGRFNKYLILPPDGATIARAIFTTRRLLSKFQPNWWRIVCSENGYHVSSVQNFAVSDRYSAAQFVPNSPDLTPCDFFLFPNLKRLFTGQTFLQIDISTTEVCFIDLQKTYFSHVKKELGELLRQMYRAKRRPRRRSSSFFLL